MMFSFCFGGDHQDWQVLERGIGTNRLQQGEAVHVRHVPVGHDEFDSALFQPAERDRTVFASSTLWKPSSLSRLRTIRRMVEKSSTTRNLRWFCRPCVFDPYLQREHRLSLLARGCVAEVLERRGATGAVAGKSAERYGNSSARSRKTYSLPALVSSQVKGLREGGFQRIAVVADFDDEQALGIEMRVRFLQHEAHQVEPIAGGERHSGSRRYSSGSIAIDPR